jgi:chromosome segregation and condensation protein ScpB
MFGTVSAGLSGAKGIATEIVAVVAQYQPATRVEIEDVRGAPLSQAAFDIGDTIRR